MNKSFKAKYSYFYLLSLVALIFLAISLGMILFNIINISVGDNLIERTFVNYDNQLKFAISALLISAPVYYLSQYLIKKGFKKNEFSKESNLRKWLIYLILFVSSVIILGLLISLFNNFLRGELTARFVLKAVSVFFLSAFVFLYYLYNLQSSRKKIIEKIFLFSSVVIILTIFISAFFFIESPQTARDRKYDQNLLNNIHNLEALVNDYYNHNDRLPTSIEEIRSFNSRMSYINLDSLNLIDYQLISETEFEFCADFRLEDKDCIKGNLWSKK
jgi:hypothetical protein